MDGAVANLFKQGNISFGAVFGTVIVLIAAAAVVLLSNRLIWKLTGGTERRLAIPYETALTIARSVTAALWVIAAMLILNLWGVSLSGLWTLLISAAAVVGVGFLAVWAIISNATASLFITFWRPFHMGHTVELLPENLKGRVIDRNMMFTVLREEDGSVLQIPNNLFFQKVFRVSGNAERSYFEYLESRGRPESEGQAAGG